VKPLTDDELSSLSGREGTRRGEECRREGVAPVIGDSAFNELPLAVLNSKCESVVSELGPNGGVGSEDWR
jgi:hypothetical protein